MKKQLIATLAIVTLASTGTVFAAEPDCGNAPESQWMSKEDATAKSVEMGYDIKQVKAEDGCYELYATKDGEKMELFLNPVSGELVKTK